MNVVFLWLSFVLLVILCTVLCHVSSLCFFFFKQKTAYDLRISDWSSDLCSSDLQIETVALNKWFQPARGFTARLWNAGHILGSTSVEMQVGETRLLFSGDLGPDHKAFHADPEGPAGLDHVICESTYGDRAREDLTIEQLRTLLEGEIQAAFTRGGNLVIPVFRSEEHTSELQSL